MLVVFQEGWFKMRQTLSQICFPLLLVIVCRTKWNQAVQPGPQVPVPNTRPLLIGITSLITGMVVDPVRTEALHKTGRAKSQGSTGEIEIIGIHHPMGKADR